MTRVIMAEGCREIDIRGVRHYARGGERGYRQGGSFDVDSSVAGLVVKAGGAIASEAGSTARGIGYRCGSCGFGSFLKRCSRCGAECDRE
jgi:hypothetical protein